MADDTGAIQFSMTGDMMPKCKICCLYSGSKGNSSFIEAGGARILIDAGKSAKALCSALRDIDIDIDTVDAIFITHEHRDHISALQTLSHKHKIPIYMLLSSAERVFYGIQDEKLCDCLMLRLGDSFTVKINDLTVKAFPTPHDSLGAVGYRLTFTEDGEEYSVGYATDTGHVSKAMRENLQGCFAAIIESNHDLDMLRDGPYPAELKQRISSKKGHLSNVDCAEFAAELYEGGTRYIMLAHLSEENNLPELAYNETFSSVADESVNIRVASQDEPVWLFGQKEV